MRKELPARPSLEHLKSQAKDLLDAYQRGDGEARARVKDALPAAHGKEDFALKLHDAQSIIAREYGFASFGDLRAHVEQQPTRELVQALMHSHLNAPMPPELLEALAAATSGPRQKECDVPIADPLPAVAVRNALLSAGAVAPFNIGRPATVAAIEAAQRGAGVLAIFSQKDATNDAPGEADLHPVGCAARVLAFVRTEKQGSWLVVRALKWIRLGSIERREPFLSAKVSDFEVVEEPGAEVTRLHELLRARVRELAKALPQSDRLLAMLEPMSALELADATIANLPYGVEEKARYAEETSLIARLKYLLGLVGVQS